MERCSEQGNVSSVCVRAGKCVANGATITGIFDKR